MKKQLALGDSLETHQDGINISMNSPNLKNITNSFGVEKCDQFTLTDQLICNCSCDSIPKLKQKAHKSFMQAIQIQTLYKEQIQQLKKFYEDSLKTEGKKFKIKQDRLNQKCKELEGQIQLIKQQYERARLNKIQYSIQSPFDLDNVDSIVQAYLPDQSTESIYNICQYLLTPNLKDSSMRLLNDIQAIVLSIKNENSKLKNDEDIINYKEFSNNLLITQQKLFQNLECQLNKIFEFINKLIQNTVQAHEKYNSLARLCNQAENKYFQLHNQHEIQQKQSKFMAEHIKRISQDKIRMQKKSNQLERTNKGLQQNIKQLKKSLIEQQLKIPHQLVKKDSQSFNSFNLINLISDDEDTISQGSMLSSNTAKKIPCLTRSAQNNQLNTNILGRCINFKKKSADKPSKNFNINHLP